MIPDRSCDYVWEGKINYGTRTDVPGTCVRLPNLSSVRLSLSAVFYYSGSPVLHEIYTWREVNTHGSHVVLCICIVMLRLLARYVISQSSSVYVAFFSYLLSYLSVTPPHGSERCLGLSLFVGLFDWLFDCLSGFLFFCMFFGFS